MMGILKNFVTPLHQSTVRDYLSRMVDDKVDCMLKAKQYEQDYWDGDRRFGYGGYKFIEGRWKPVAQALISDYNLTNESSILDVGCGKGFLLYEIKKILPNIKVVGFDVSKHGVFNAHPDIKQFIKIQKAQNPYPHRDQEFDLVISLGTLHNLRLFDLKSALIEFQRVGKAGYIMLESYRNEQELFNLQCWALTCESFFDKDEWIWLYEHFGYKGDFEFIYFE
jgi:ubiquinone/menaquinone biosynthesis C-methylase UbiE